MSRRDSAEIGDGVRGTKLAESLHMTTRTVIGVLALAVAIALGLVMVGASRRWDTKVRDLVRRLADSSTVRVATYSERQIDGLPPPVQRYFRAALVNGQPVVAHARVVSRGTFNMGKPPADAWKPFTATQDFYPAAPGFVWNARVRMAPGVDAYVRDAFVNGEGSMVASALGMVTIVNAHATRELVAGALMRYLAEAPWLPTALLPSQGVRWTSLSPTVATATLTVGDVTVALNFHFDADGRITTCEGLRDNDDLHAKFPWGGVYRHWIKKAGMTIPSEADVSWQLPTGTFSYWRGTVEPDYDFADDERSDAAQ